MIKSELIKKISSKMTNLSETQVTNCTNHIINTMSDTLLQNQRIEIRGFGSFALRYRKARNAHNPRTGEKVIASPKYRLHFKPGKQLCEQIQKTR